MRKVYLSWQQVQGHCIEIARQLQKDNWQPDYVVGITRGGSTPAVMLSQFLNAPCEMLKVSLRDGNQSESNCWMAEDAFGYISKEDRKDDAVVSDPKLRKNILIVDDINDSGATINWIKQDWQSSCIPKSEQWGTIWHQNVRFAVLVNNESSHADVTYSSMLINKFEDPQWIVFPWEEWWK